MTATGTTGRPKVWDLADASVERSVRRRGTDPGGPVAAALGVVAFAAAAAPGVADPTRWSVVAAAGSIAVLVGFSAMRRRQAVLSLLLALAGLVLPVVAGVVTIADAVRAPAAVHSTVAAHELRDPPGGLQPSAAFASLSGRQQSDASAFATTLVERIRTLHGSFGPYPTSLSLSHGSVVEGSGRLGGMSLGVVPAEARLLYTVSRSGDAFRVTVVSRSDEDATVTATSSLVTALP
ncbi:hypothetical protein [Amnibacterium kyonggiense]|uniref:Uncharacterized protein n=1 Tax=Amnibacterium kyonggiense TaxID=595671 RepID=A0A4R7FLQ6_9MICO|nr:hypothetical protein [Amnibacterium kyonggiense]TDS77309.1 hypothetical protein CLV52_2252 [Amnibacterium kyonggiense]